jgi:hypothetical protein
MQLLVVEVGLGVSPGLKVLVVRMQKMLMGLRVVAVAPRLGVRLGRLRQQSTEGRRVATVA